MISPAVQQSRGGGLVSRAATLLVATVLLLAVASPAVSADDGGVAVQILPTKKECFYEPVAAAGIKVFLHYMVTSGGALDVDAEVLNPEGMVVWKSEKESENRVLFKSTKAGRYAFCFSNEMSTVTAKVVAFSVLVGDGSSQAGAGGKRDSLRDSIFRIQQGLREIEEIQGFLRSREREHRATTEVANTRVIMWSLLEIAAIVGMGAANVYYLRRMFTTKRMV